MRLGTWENVVDGSFQEFDCIDLTSRHADLGWLAAALKIPARGFLRKMPFLGELISARDAVGGRIHGGVRILPDRTLAPKVLDVTARGRSLRVVNERKNSWSSSVTKMT